MFPVNPETFQFHKGTIKTFMLNLRLIVRDVFQFHKGTIKTSETLEHYPIALISIP